MARDPIPTWFFALVVVRHGDRFLLVQERRHGELWYLPAGRAEPGESLADAARRETLEESGVAVRLTGVLRVEHSSDPGFARLRVIFLAEPSGSTEPKRDPDDDTLGAEWVRLADLQRYPLRDPEVEEVFRYVAAGGRSAPLSLLQDREGAPFVVE